MRPHGRCGLRLLSALRTYTRVSYPRRRRLLCGTGVVAHELRLILSDLVMSFQGTLGGWGQAGSDIARKSEAYILFGDDSQFP